ncbi:tripartite tricarboxylate transporter substrate binding protein [Xylophilus sp. GOD-11R]|uniref:Bug family tripartite tricarboxylate transporter substrate binding protein n=1 Tax=Xylophilus sp. GOD-11R TaxID=3089814 RepID=UPI00298CA503|nr:tripartite tricarboxylate transporter substrate binding protein [Xylophilus sp. GOD-11R]WPB56594.1 tripartite tricarboxylate transporter substrate binding protein [Xylophilus sp. GOD-11R]
MNKTATRRAALLALAATWAGARAQAPAGPKPTLWPTRPLHIVVGFPAGSSPDITARTLAEPLSRALGQPVIVDNKVGAGGNIAAEFVARATDDHTIGLMINGNLTIARLINPRIHYDPLRDFAPIGLIGTSPLVLAAPIQSPGADARAFLQAARQAGDRWSYGTPGVGTVGHVGMELLKRRLRIAPVHVPYPGYPQVANAMIAGELQLALLPPSLAAAQARAGKLRALGVTARTRSTLVPEIPSLKEAGVDDFELEIWNAVAAPAGMPRAVVERLSTLFSEIVRTPDMRTRLFQQGWQAVGGSSEGLTLRMRSDAVTMGEVIRSARITAE